MFKKMTMDELISKLLYVPFNDDYRVTSNIKEILTEDVFFNECYIKPDFDEEIEKSLGISNEEVNDFEWNIEKEDIVKKLEKRKEKLGVLDSWIKSSQSDLYCIRGDAGTDKTTFLHYLKHEYCNYNISWHIVDIQQAIREIPILQKRITIPRFHSLYSKAISAILYHFISSVFKKDPNGRLLTQESEQHINDLAKNFGEKFCEAYPREEISNFFNTVITPSKEVGDTSRRFCEKCANNIAQWANEILHSSTDEDKSFTIILELLVYYAVCSGNTTRHMIAFDNFERFIGTDEIYDGQLTKFVSSLRSIQQSIVNSNKHIDNIYQIIIFMRNTSVRMFTSQQVTEFFPHDIDLSDWFDVGSVLKKKIEWYCNNNIDIEETRILQNIFNDMGECGNTLRGLHFKISMLFNYNKRIVIEFLARVLFSRTNQEYIEVYNSYWNNENSVKSSLNKFAARSIIYRLILNALREDGFFVNIVAQTAPAANYCGSSINSLGYARKILSILYEHDINCALNADSRYMPFENLIRELFQPRCNSLELLLNETNEEKLDTIAQVLFYMNYYNVRKDNWLQFVDLQYNADNSQNIVISDYDSLKKYIKTNSQDIKIRITNAGKAYLYFVAYYFEFFSCKSIHKQNQKKFFQDKDMPPLLCTIPTIDEIKKGNFEEFICIKIIKVVLLESLSCISVLNQNEHQIRFRFNLSDRFISHQQRIVNSHRGFIDNFVEFIKLYYSNQYKEDIAFTIKFDILIKLLQDLRNQYNADYTESIGEDNV